MKFARNDSGFIQLIGIIALVILAIALPITVRFVQEHRQVTEIRQKAAEDRPGVTDLYGQLPTPTNSPTPSPLAYNPDGCQPGWQCGTAPNGTNCGTCDKGDECITVAHTCRPILAAPSGDCERRGFSCMRSKDCQTENGTRQPYACFGGLVCCDLSGPPAPDITPTNAPTTPLAEKIAQCANQKKDFDPKTGGCVNRTTTTSSAGDQRCSPPCSSSQDCRLVSGRSFGELSSYECIEKSAAPSLTPTPTTIPAGPLPPPVDVCELDARCTAAREARRSCESQKNQSAAQCAVAEAEAYRAVEGDLATRASRGDTSAEKRLRGLAALTKAAQEAAIDPTSEAAQFITLAKDAVKGGTSINPQDFIRYAYKSTDCLSFDDACRAADAERQSCAEYKDKTKANVDCQSRAIGAYIATEAALSPEKRALLDKIKVLGDVGVKQLLAKYPDFSSQEALKSILATCAGTDCSPDSLKDKAGTVATIQVKDAAEAAGALAQAECANQSDSENVYMRCIRKKQAAFAATLPALAIAAADVSCKQKGATEKTLDDCRKDVSNQLASGDGLKTLTQFALSAITNCPTDKYFGKERDWCFTRYGAPINGIVTDDDLADYAVGKLVASLCDGPGAQSSETYADCVARNTKNFKDSLPNLAEAIGSNDPDCVKETDTVKKRDCIVKKKDEFLGSPLGLYQIAQTTRSGVAPCRDRKGDDFAFCMTQLGVPIYGAVSPVDYNKKLCEQNPDLHYIPGQSDAFDCATGKAVADEKLKDEILACKTNQSTCTVKFTRVTDLDQDCSLKKGCDVAQFAFNWCKTRSGAAFQFTDDQKVNFAWCERQVSAEEQRIRGEKGEQLPSKAFTRASCNPDDHKEIPNYCNQFIDVTAKYLPYLKQLGVDIAAGQTISPELSEYLVYTQPYRPGDFFAYISGPCVLSESSTEATDCDAFDKKVKEWDGKLNDYCAKNPLNNIIVGYGSGEQYVRCNGQGKPEETDKTFLTGLKPNEVFACGGQQEDPKQANACPDWRKAASTSKNDIRLAVSGLFVRDPKTVDGIGDTILKGLAGKKDVISPVDGGLPDCSSNSSMRDSDRCKKFRENIKEWLAQIHVAPDSVPGCDVFGKTDAGANVSDTGKRGFWSKEQCVEAATFVSFQTNTARRIERTLFRPTDIFTDVGTVKLRTADLGKAVADLGVGFVTGTAVYGGFYALGAATSLGSGIALPVTGGIFVGIAGGEAVNNAQVRNDVLALLNIPCNISGTKVGDLNLDCRNKEEKQALANGIRADAARDVPDPFAPPKFAVDPSRLGGKTIEQVLAAMAKVNDTCTAGVDECLKQELISTEDAASYRQLDSLKKEYAQYLVLAKHNGGLILDVNQQLEDSVRNTALALAFSAIPAIPKAAQLVGGVGSTIATPVSRIGGALFEHLPSRLQGGLAVVGEGLASRGEGLSNVGQRIGTSVVNGGKGFGAALGDTADGIGSAFHNSTFAKISRLDKVGDALVSVGNQWGQFVERGGFAGVAQKQKPFNEFDFTSWTRAESLAKHQALSAAGASANVAITGNRTVEVADGVRLVHPDGSVTVQNGARVEITRAGGTVEAFEVGNPVGPRPIISATDRSIRITNPGATRSQILEIPGLGASLPGVPAVAAAPVRTQPSAPVTTRPVEIVDGIRLIGPDGGVTVKNGARVQITKSDGFVDTFTIGNPVGARPTISATDISIRITNPGARTPFSLPIANLTTQEPVLIGGPSLGSRIHSALDNLVNRPETPPRPAPGPPIVVTPTIPRSGGTQPSLLTRAQTWVDAHNPFRPSQPGAQARPVAPAVSRQTVAAAERNTSSSIARYYDGYHGQDNGSVLRTQLYTPGEIPKPYNALILSADGHGTDGAKASALATERFPQLFTHYSEQIVRQTGRTNPELAAQWALDQIHQDILRLAPDGGTTFTAGIRIGDRELVVQLGDSRLYRFSGRLELVTPLHNAPGDTHLYNLLVTKSLGDQGPLNLARAAGDTAYVNNFTKASIRWVQANKNDIFVAGSDSLEKLARAMGGEDKLNAFLLEAIRTTPTERLAPVITQKALEFGVHDDISAFAYKVLQRERSASAALSSAGLPRSQPIAQARPVGGLQPVAVNSGIDLRNGLGLLADLVEGKVPKVATTLRNWESKLIGSSGQTWAQRELAAVQQSTIAYESELSIPRRIAEDIDRVVASRFSPNAATTADQAQINVQQLVRDHLDAILPHGANRDSVTFQWAKDELVTRLGNDPRFAGAIDDMAAQVEQILLRQKSRIVNNLVREQTGRLSTKPIDVKLGNAVGQSPGAVVQTGMAIEVRTAGSTAIYEIRPGDVMYRERLNPGGSSDGIFATTRGQKVTRDPVAVGNTVYRNENFIISRNGADIPVELHGTNATVTVSYPVTASAPPARAAVAPAVSVPAADQAESLNRFFGTSDNSLAITRNANGRVVVETTSLDAPIFVRDPARPSAVRFLRNASDAQTQWRPAVGATTLENGGVYQISDRPVRIVETPGKGLSAVDIRTGEIQIIVEPKGLGRLRDSLPGAKDALRLSGVARPSAVDRVKAAIGTISDSIFGKRVGVLSDYHGDVEAFERVLRQRGITDAAGNPTGRLGLLGGDAPGKYVSGLPNDSGMQIWFRTADLVDRSDGRIVALFGNWEVRYPRAIRLARLLEQDPTNGTIRTQLSQLFGKTVSAQELEEILRPENFYRVIESLKRFKFIHIFEDGTIAQHSDIFHYAKYIFRDVDEARRLLGQNSDLLTIVEEVIGKRGGVNLSLDDLTALNAAARTLGWDQEAVVARINANMREVVERGMLNTTNVADGNGLALMELDINQESNFIPVGANRAEIEHMVREYASLLSSRPQAGILHGHVPVDVLETSLNQAGIPWSGRVGEYRVGGIPITDIDYRIPRGQRTGNIPGYNQLAAANEGVLPLPVGSQLPPLESPIQNIVTEIVVSNGLSRPNFPTIPRLRISRPQLTIPSAARTAVRAIRAIPDGVDSFLRGRPAIAPLENASLDVVLDRFAQEGGAGRIEMLDAEGRRIGAAIPFVDTPAGRTSLAQRFFEGRGTNIRFVPDGFLAPRLTFRAATPGQAFALTEQVPASFGDRLRAALARRPAPAAPAVVPQPNPVAPGIPPVPAAQTAPSVPVPVAVPAARVRLTNAPLENAFDQIAATGRRGKIEFLDANEKRIGQAVAFDGSGPARTSLAQRFEQSRAQSIRFIPDNFLAPRSTFRASTAGQAFSVTEQAPRSLVDRAREAIDQWITARPAPATPAPVVSQFNPVAPGIPPVLARPPAAPAVPAPAAVAPVVRPSANPRLQNVSLEAALDRFAQEGGAGRIEMLDAEGRRIGAAIPFVDTPAGRTSLAQRFFEGRGTNIRFVPDGFLAPRLTFRAATPGQAFSVTEQAPRSIADRAREALDQWRSARPAPAAQSVPVPVPARSAPAAIPAPAARAGGFQIPRLAPASALVLLLPLPFIGGSLPSITLPNTSDVKSFVESLIFRYRQKPSVPVSLFGVAPISRSGVVPVPKVTPLPVYQFPTVPGLVAKPAAPPVGPAVIAGVTSFCTRSGCRVTNDPKNAPIRVCTFSGSCEGNYSSFCGPSWQEIVSGKNHATCIDLAPGKTYETPAVKISCGSWQTDIAVNEKPLAADHGIDLTSCGGGKASTNSLKSIKELGVTTLSPGTVILSNAIALTIPKGAVTKITDTTVTITLPDGTVITLPSDNVYIGFGDAPADASLYNRGVTPSPTPTKTPTPTPTTKKPDGASVYTATCMTPAQLDAIGGEITSSVHLCGGTYRPITVKSSNIFVDCAGNCQIDAGTGTGVSVQGLDNVSITNLAIKTTTPPDQREGSLGRFGIDSWCGTFKGVGVSLVDSSGSSVSNVRIVSAGDKAGVVGIDICGGSGNEVANSDFSNNSGWGVRVVASDGNKILHNTANGNIRSGANESACALLVGNRTVGKGADGNILYGNNLNGCGDGVYINGYDFPTSNGNVIANNYIDSAQANCIEATGNATAGTSGTNIIVNNTVGQRCGNYQGWITYTKNTFYCGNGKGTVVTKESSGTIVDDSAVCPDSALANAEKQGIALGHLSEALVVSQPKGPATNNDASIRVNRIDLPFAESALQRDADVRRDLANQSCNPSKDEPKVVPSELGIVVCTDAGRSVGDGRFVGQCQPTQKSYDPANDTFLWCGDNARWVPYEDPAERANLVAAIKQEHDLEAKYDLNVYNRVGYWHDLNVVDSALSRFSKSDIKGITLEGIIRPSTEFNGSYILGSGGYADPSQKNRASYILTNKSVTAEGQQRIESVITHEIIHVIDQNKGYLSDSQDFKSAIAAEKITFSSDGIYKGGQLLSKDYNCSKPNPVELFACVGSVFKISPEKLQKDIPQMYTYFQGTKI